MLVSCLNLVLKLLEIRPTPNYRSQNQWWMVISMKDYWMTSLVLILEHRLFMLS